MPKAWQLPVLALSPLLRYLENAALKIVWGIVNLMAWPVF